MWFLHGLLSISQCYKTKYELSGKAAKPGTALWLDKLMYARSLLEFGELSWLVLETLQVCLLQWGQAERSTTQPWDLSFSSSGAPESPPTISLIPFPRSMRLVYFDTRGCCRKPVYRCWPISHICWWISLDQVVLPPCPHDAFWVLVWRQHALAETARSLYEGVCFSKVGRGKSHTWNRTSTGKYPSFLGHCSWCHSFLGLIRHYVDFIGFCLIN